MVDRRLPSISIPPPGPYSQNYRVLPSPRNLPPISQFYSPPVNHPSTNYSHRYLIPPTSAPQIGSNVQARPFYAHNAASFQGAGSTSSAPSPAPAGTIRRLALIHGGDGEVGKVDFDQMWIEKHLAELEAFARNDSGEEKGKIYLGVWLGTREAGLRDKQGVRLFMAKNFMPYHWFKGDETIREALRALHRLEFMNAGLLARKHTENAMWYWDKKIGNVTVREFWTEEGEKLRQKAETQANAQAQAQAQTQR